MEVGPSKKIIVKSYGVIIYYNIEERDEETSIVWQLDWRIQLEVWSASMVK